MRKRREGEERGIEGIEEREGHKGRRAEGRGEERGGEGRRVEKFTVSHRQSCG